MYFKKFIYFELVVLLIKMVIRARENVIGAWAFLIGVILAIIIGLSTTAFLPLTFIDKYDTQVYALLVLSGVIVGFANVRGVDSQRFLLAGTVLVIVSNFGMSSVTGSLIGISVVSTVKSIFGALLAMFVPATIIVALKTVFDIAKV